MCLSKKTTTVKEYIKDSSKFATVAVAPVAAASAEWIVYDNRRRSGQWLDTDVPPRHFPKAKTHQQKTMVTVWWSAAGVIHYNFRQLGQTIIAESYCEEIEEMYRKLRQQQPALVNRTTEEVRSCSTTIPVRTFHKS